MHERREKTCLFTFPEQNQRFIARKSLDIENVIDIKKTPVLMSSQTGASETSST